MVGTASLLFIGGKGGVGKTTVAAATALRLARADSTRRVLLLSTDPAHSLGDVFQTTVGDTTKTIGDGPSNLDVRELDAAHAFGERRAQFETALDDISSSSGIPRVPNPLKPPRPRDPNSDSKKSLKPVPPN